MTDAPSFQTHLDSLPWQYAATGLCDYGVALMRDILDVQDCADLQKLSGRDGVFHKTVVMKKKGYGCGTYGYFATVPAQVAALRRAFYENTVDLANDWLAETKKRGKNMFGVDAYPKTLEEFAGFCAQNGQDKQPCLLLNYGDGGYNILHQDKYGPRQIAYPFQLVVQLSRPGIDFTDGEFLLEEESAVRRFNPRQGEGVIFPSVCRVDGNDLREVRHGVDRVTGKRCTLGVIAHGLDR